jgi:hypothetical protein
MFPWSIPMTCENTSLAPNPLTAGMLPARKDAAKP